jgi:hypothetical protein
MFACLSLLKIALLCPFFPECTRFRRDAILPRVAACRFYFFFCCFVCFEKNFVSRARLPHRNSALK